MLEEHFFDQIKLSPLLQGLHVKCPSYIIASGVKELSWYVSSLNSRKQRTIIRKKSSATSVQSITDCFAREAATSRALRPGASFCTIYMSVPDVVDPIAIPSDAGTFRDVISYVFGRKRRCEIVTHRCGRGHVDEVTFPLCIQGSNPHFSSFAATLYQKAKPTSHIPTCSPLYVPSSTLIVATIRRKTRKSDDSSFPLGDSLVKDVEEVGSTDATASSSYFEYTVTQGHEDMPISHPSLDTAFPLPYPHTTVSMPEGSLRARIRRCLLTLVSHFSISLCGVNVVGLTVTFGISNNDESDLSLLSVNALAVHRTKEQRKRKKAGKSVVSNPSKEMNRSLHPSSASSVKSKGFTPRSKGLKSPSPYAQPLIRDSAQIMAHKKVKSVLKKTPKGSGYGRKIPSQPRPKTANSISRPGMRSSMSYPAQTPSRFTPRPPSSDHRLSSGSVSTLSKRPKSAIVRPKSASMVPPLPPSFSVSVSAAARPPSEQRLKSLSTPKHVTMKRTKIDQIFHREVVEEEKKRKRKAQEWLLQKRQAGVLDLLVYGFKDEQVHRVGDEFGDVGIERRSKSANSLRPSSAAFRRSDMNPSPFQGNCDAKIPTRPRPSSSYSSSLIRELPCSPIRDYIVTGDVGKAELASAFFHEPSDRENDGTGIISVTPMQQQPASMAHPAILSEKEEIGGNENVAQSIQQEQAQSGEDKDDFDEDFDFEDDEEKEQKKSPQSEIPLTSKKDTDQVPHNTSEFKHPTDDDEFDEFDEFDESPHDPSDVNPNPLPQPISERSSPLSRSSVTTPTRMRSPSTRSSSHLSNSPSRCQSPLKASSYFKELSSIYMPKVPIDLRGETVMGKSHSPIRRVCGRLNSHIKDSEVESNSEDGNTLEKLQE
ncbi:hypothetical protein ADUPG1_011209 [Aduncisulcus paluster]|uniref:Uncharacterized protein n=1 Tax=Aduncisulcus paluster TaxID=2918883 RepID=A0ABQ5JUR8_9EUKA|nr:hypothetical protein ADUPG1_011209 [Aduncisulcus paluster]